MFTMKAPNGEMLIARDELQKEIMEKAGFEEVKEVEAKERTRRPQKNE